MGDPSLFKAENKKLIYTLGTSNRSVEEFLAILKKFQITQVIDVRRWPTSKYFLHFKKENLEKFLKESRIDYFHLENLGGYRTAGYEVYSKTKDFKKGLKDLIKISKRKPTIFICAERLPWKCHRVFISRELEKLGFKIIHIIDLERVWQPKKEPRELKLTCQKRLK